MKLRYAHDQCLHVFFVTEQFKDLIFKPYAPFTKLSLETLIKDYGVTLVPNRSDTYKLTIQELGYILKTQHAVMGILGATAYNPVLPASLSEFEKQSIARAMNEVDGDAIKAELKKRKYFHFNHIGNTLFIALTDNPDWEKGWTRSGHHTLGSAILEGIYRSVGYQRLHLNSFTKPLAAGEITLANILRQVHVETLTKVAV